jgi:hypothetical protein
MPSARCPLCLAFLCILCTQVVAADVGTLSAREALERFRSARDHQSDLQLSGTTQTLVRGTARRGKVGGEKIQFRVIRDGNRVRLQTHESILGIDGNAFPEPPSEQTYVDDGAHSVEVTSNDGAKPAYATVYRSGSPRATELLATVNFHGPLEGYVDGNEGKRLDQVLIESADLRVLPEREIGGRRCVVIAGSTPYGSGEMWIDVTREFALAGFTFSKGPNDLYDGVPVSKLPHKWKSIDTRLENVQLQRVAGRVVPMAGEYTALLELTNGNKSRLVSQFRRESITFKPTLGSDTFKIVLPDGTPIYNGDLKAGASGVEYEWRDGQVVVAHDPKVLDGIKEGLASPPVPKRAPSGSGSALWIATVAMASLGMILCAVLGVRLYRRA